MAVYYKFKSAKDYDSIPIEGQFISLANLKERIFEIKLFGKGTDFDLMISNAQNNEEYVDEGAMIPKNTSVLIRRVPGRPRKPIVTGIEETKVVEDKVEDLPPSSSMLVGDSSTTKYPEEYEWDEFGNDLYAVPEVNPAQASNPVLDVSPANMVDEDSKIKALIDTPALDWNRQTQEGYGSGRGFGRGSGSRMMGGRGFGRGMLERKTPPAGYVCHRCKVPGHFIQHCPTNGDPNYDIKRVKPPTGIPKSMLMATPDGSYALPSGAAAVLKPNEAAFEKEIEGLPTTRPVSDLPPELRCPLCKEVMKDAVLTSKCCFRSFCDKCIRDYIITKLMCICGATNILADDLLPNKTLRETISRILESTTSSTENAGSLVQVQDMESARPLQPKVPSPTYSVASKDEPMQHTVEQSSHMKEGEVASEVKATNNDMNSSDKKAIINTPASEDVPESLSMKGPKSFESAPVPEDAQEKQLAGEQGKKKKKKKARLPGTAADMQWRSYQDFGAENYGMPLPPPGYNPHWSGGMPMGVDGYMAPFGGAMPFMGYTPGPFDIPYGGGIFPQDPFVAQGFMMPAVPRDLSELNMGSMGMNQNQGPSGMSRDDYGARKAADLRRKREMERLREREREQSKDRDARRESSSMNDASSSSMRPKPTAMSQSDRSDRHRDRDRSEKTASVINTSLYLCDNKFHTEALAELLESDQKFGFIIMDGNGALFGTLSGNTREVVHKFSVDLPKKHGRGGQSALRFARLREEKRHNYVRKVAELAVQNFITADKVNVAGLILAGSADFKNDLNASDMFDGRLATKVIKVVDVSYGGENGFNQAIELSSETLGNVKFIQEKKLIGKYFEEISQDTGKVCYGIEDTLKALELGAVETLIVFENLEITRWVLKDSNGSEVILHTTKQQEQTNRDKFLDKETGQEMEIVSQESFLEWIAEHYKDFGTTLEFVSDRSTEGNQFVKGFGGIGGLLRYKVNFEQLADLSDDDEYYDD